MVGQRAFYVTQGSLTVWQRGMVDPKESLLFPDSDDGLRQFDEYLSNSDELLSFVVADVIEEEFALEKFPKVGMRDRKSLMQRRVRRKFPRTPYRLPVYQGRASDDDSEEVVVHSAISNHELLDPWLQIILRHELPLTGIYSVPLMAPDLLQKLCKPQASALLLTQHQENKLRQVFMQGGHAQSARLSQSPAITDAEYPQFVITEIGRSRLYLERGRLLGNKDPLNAYIVADKKLAKRILDCAASDSPLKIHFIDPDAAAKKVGARAQLVQDRLEFLYLATSFRKRPKLNYAISGESRFWNYRRLRHGIIGLTAMTAAVCSMLSGLYLSDAWFLNKRSEDIEYQLDRLTETFRRENEQFDPILADSHEMKLAVDTGDFILANRLPVPWVMQQMGFVLGNYPDVQIQTLEWSVESDASNEPPPRRGNESMPVPVPAVSSVRARVIGNINPFDGDMRKAFARIDSLADELQNRTAFSRVSVVEYPLDARPQSSLSGEISTTGIGEQAAFQLTLSFQLPAAPADGSEVGDESA
ncbi:MAG: hypothetical protein ACR2QT_06250 [Woeseiaceae bacterium]